MRLFYSGGSPIPEVTLDKPDIMLSAYVDTRNWKPNARLRVILEIRRGAKRRANKEVWKTVPGYEGIYQASSFGRIRSLDRKIVRKDGETRKLRGKVLSPNTINKYGHQSVFLTDNTGNSTSLSVGAVVLMAFVGPRPPRMEARHYPDRNPKNNRPENLQWSSRTVNQRDRVEHGTHNRGERSGLAKLTELDVLLIRLLVKTKKRSYKQLAHMFNVDDSTISGIVLNKTWRHI